MLYLFNNSFSPKTKDMFQINDVVDDEFVKIDDSRKIVRHRRMNLLVLITLSMCAYFTYGWCNDMLDLSR
jgi:hypothetical protein